MAIAMRERSTEFQAGWNKRGYDLDIGIGIVQGYATLGAIGFEGRWDYGVIGTVTNLASRLCGERRTGQILVSSRLLGRLRRWSTSSRWARWRSRGSSSPVPVFNVVRLEERRLIIPSDTALTLPSRAC